MVLFRILLLYAYCNTIHSTDGKNKESADNEGKMDSPNNNDKVKGSSMAEKAAVLLKKRPTLTDRELNPEFFQKLETRITDELAVEVVVPRKTLQSHLQSEEEPEDADGDPVGPANSNGSADDEANLTQLRSSSNFQNIRDRWAGQRGSRNKDAKVRTSDVQDRNESSAKDSASAAMNVPGEGPSLNNKTNWLAIQRQLSHLDRQQTSLMNMLQVSAVFIYSCEEVVGISFFVKKQFLRRNVQDITLF